MKAFLLLLQIAAAILLLSLPTSAAPTKRSHSAHFRLDHAQVLDQRDVERLLDLLEVNRSDLLRRVSAAGLNVRFPDLELVVNETTGDFVGRTGMPSWAAAATHGHRIELQPLKLLKERRILETTLRHELVHVLIEEVGDGPTPRWLAEGMAVYIAGEGKRLEPYLPHGFLETEAIERLLATAQTTSEMRTAYAAAYNIVRKLIQLDGEKKIWQRISRKYL